MNDKIEAELARLQRLFPDSHIWYDGQLIHIDQCSKPGWHQKDKDEEREGDVYR